MGNKSRFYVDIMSMNPGVTGSCNLVVVRFPAYTRQKVRFIVDCGLFQERTDEKLNNEFQFNPENIDFALITHNHVDHVGRLPLLTKKGFRGPIYTTEATKRLLPYSLWDCNKVMKEKCKRKHEKLIFRSEDVTTALSLVKSCKYGKEIKITDNIYATFLDNGHIVGSALIYVRITFQGYDDIHLLFTGDYKSENAFLDLKPVPEHILKAPITIIQESTYGDMEKSEIKPCFKENLLKCIEKKGTVIAPVFSLGRSQEILYELRCLQDEGKLSTEIPIYLDGKLAISYTYLYLTDLGIKKEMRDFLPENLTFVDKKSRSDLFDNEQCKIILTTSGMGSYGTAKTYIMRYISKKDALIHFTGYTTEGTLGARLKSTPDGASVEISGIITKKLAKVEYTTEFSAHAKANEMISFLQQFENLKLVLLNHGEQEVKELFADRIVNEVKPKNVGILGGYYLFRVDSYGLIKTLSTKFQ